MGVYEEMLAWQHKLEELPPPITKLECGQAVWELIADEVKWENEQRTELPWFSTLPKLPYSLTGVMVIVKTDMPVNEWRLFSGEEVVREGSL